MAGAVRDPRFRHGGRRCPRMVRPPRNRPPRGPHLRRGRQLPARDRHRIAAGRINRGVPLGGTTPGSSSASSPPRLRAGVPPVRATHRASARRTRRAPRTQRLLADRQPDLPQRPLHGGTRHHLTAARRCVQPRRRRHFADDPPATDHVLLGASFAGWLVERLGGRPLVVSAPPASRSDCS